MKNVSDRNLKLLDILLGPLEKTDPLQEINRIFKLYFDKLIFVDDQYLMNTFRGIVENKIYCLIILMRHFSIRSNMSILIPPPTRFVGLHGHTGFSVFDGLGYPADHIDFVLETSTIGIHKTTSYAEQPDQTSE